MLLVHNLLLLLRSRNFDESLVRNLPDCTRIQARNRGHLRFVAICVGDGGPHHQRIFRHQIYGSPVNLRRNFHCHRRVFRSFDATSVMGHARLHLPTRPRMRSRLPVSYPRDSSTVRRNRFKPSHQHPVGRILCRLHTDAACIRSYRHKIFGSPLADCTFRFCRIVTFMRVPAGLRHAP